MFYAILYGVPNKSNVHYCIHLFMPLFIIPSQSIIDKILANAFRKTSIEFNALSFRTRVVIVEFTMYSPSQNFNSVVRLAAELPISGIEHIV